MSNIERIEDEAASTTESKIRLQRQLQNGAWVAEERVEMFLDQALEREVWYAPRVGREPMTSRSQLIAYLETGKSIRCGDDWYDEIRIEPKPQPAAPEPTLVKCACGHSVPVALVMTTSTGTSCPDCYDRMSD